MSEQPAHVPRIVAVLGRGLETASAEFPGTVQPNSPVSGDSYDRAVAAARYVRNHPGTDQVIFSGAWTFALAPEQIPGDATEAQAMEAVALQLGMPAGVSTVEDKSKSTYGNWIQIQHDVAPDAHIGVVVHKNHARRALKIGACVMPHAQFTVIEADNPERTGYNPRPTINDRLSAAIYGVYMFGTKPGDIARLQCQDELVQKRVIQVQRAVRTLGKIVGNLAGHFRLSTERNL